MKKDYILPRAGTVAGAVIGFVGGVLGNMFFDSVWDHKDEIAKTVSNTFNSVKKEGGKVVNNIVDSAKGFVDGLCNLGSVFG